MKKYLKLAGMSTVILALTACASTPKQDPVQEVVQRELPPPPVSAKPAPVKPVEQAPMIIEGFVDAGPIAGSIEHFKYISGEDRVYFQYNSHSLVPQAQGVLRRQAEWLNTYSTAIVVIGGNADERGTREYNLALGARRADAVKEYLVGLGVAPSRITTVSYGKERPIDGGSTESAWAFNRNAHSAVLVGGNS